MADEKKGSKGGKKEEKKGLDATETILFWFIVLVLLGGVISRFAGVFSGDTGTSIGSGIGSFFSSSVFPAIKFILYILSVASFFGIVWCLGALTKINKVQNAVFNPPVASAGFFLPEEKKNKRWERVEGHINSENPNDWKFSILEADIILDDLLTAMGYRGETMADKLKGVEKSDFRSIELAWEAHKIRNSIAHEGADFLITEREARRVIGLYKSIFEEFDFI